MSLTRRKIVPAVFVAGFAVAAVVFLKRFDIGVWYLNRSRAVREMVILQMLETARPVIARDVQMNLPQKIWSALAGWRTEKERQTDALEDVRTFGELSFQKRWILFKKAPRGGSVNGIPLDRFRFTLAWNREKPGQVLAAFNLDFLKRKIGEMEINPDCPFFVELKAYIEERARAK